MAQLTGLRIETNIPAVTGEFDNLITHINDTLAKPFNMDFNVNQIKEQLQQVTDSVAKVQEQVNQMSNNKPLLNSAQTTEEAVKMGQTIAQIKEQLSSLGDVTIKTTSFDQTNQQFDKIIATVKNADGVVKQFQADISGMFGNDALYGNLTPKSVTDNTQNAQYQEANSLLQQQYKYQTDINNAEAKGYETTVNDLQSKKQEIDLQLQQAKSNLTDNQLVQLKQQEISLQDKLDQQLNNQADKQTQINAKVEQEVAQFKELSSIKLQNLETTMSGANGKGVDVTAIKDEVSSLKELASTVNSENFSQVQSQWNTQLKQTQANLREVTTEEGNQHNAFGSVISDMGKMATFMVSGGIMFGLVNSFQQGVQGAISMDSTLATLNITMNTTQQGLQQMQQQIQQTAIATGSSVDDVSASLKTYANASETAQTALAKTKSAIELSNVSGLNTKDVVDGIHGIIQSFDLAGQDAETTSQQISSALVSIAKNTSLDFSTAIQDMTEGIQTVGSVAAKTGKETYQQMASLIASISEVSRQSGQETANGLFFEPIVA